MDIGAMNKRVTIQKNETVTDGYGNHRNEWSDYFTCWATVSEEGGQEQAEAGQTVEHGDMSATVRYSSETAAVTSTGHRILLDGEIYDILSVDHLSYKKNALKFRCRKVRQ